METTTAQGCRGFRERFSRLFLHPLPGEHLPQADLETEVLRIHLHHQVQDLYLFGLVALLFIETVEAFQLGKGFGFETLAFVKLGQPFVGS
jgi:hypothetical protein